MNKKPWFIVFGVGIAAAVLLILFSQKEEPQSGERAEDLPPLKVEGTIVDRGEISGWVETVGKIKSRKTKKFTSPINTEIESVPVVEGEKVREGQLLLKLKTSGQRARMEEAEHELVKAREKFEFARKHQDADSSVLAVTTGLNKARMEFEKAEEIFSRLEIRAPFEGIVYNLWKEEGSGVEKGEEVLSIYSPAHLFIEASVPQVELSRIKHGNRAIVTAVNEEKSETGRVLSVSPVIGDKKTGKVSILAGTEWILGGLVKVEIESESYPDRVRVPGESVLHREGRYLVFKVTGSRAKWQWIKKGKGGRDYIEVLEGVSPGDTVLTEGQFTIAHDAPVEVNLK